MFVKFPKFFRHSNRPFITRPSEFTRYPREYYDRIFHPESKRSVFRLLRIQCYYCQKKKKKIPGAFEIERRLDRTIRPKTIPLVSLGNNTNISKPARLTLYDFTKADILHKC